MRTAVAFFAMCASAQALTLTVESDAGAVTVVPGVPKYMCDVVDKVVAGKATHEEIIYIAKMRGRRPDTPRATAVRLIVSGAVKTARCEED